MRASSAKNAMPGDEVGTVAVLDASVAVRWLVRERGSDDVGRLMEGPISWRAPHLLVTEVASAMRRKIVANELGALEAIGSIQILKSAIADGLISLVADDDLVPAALTLALLYEHKLPDCMYLALAEREGISLATADVALARIAQARGVAVIIVA